MAGNGAVDAGAALQDFDGISYEKGSSILKQVNASLGDEVFFAGVMNHFERHRFGNATMHDLFASWEQAGAGDLTVHQELAADRGPRRAAVRPAGGVVRRTPPAAHPADRSHTMRVALAAPGSPWRIARSHFRCRDAAGGRRGRGRAVDPFEETWAVVEHDERRGGAARAAAQDRGRHGPGRHLERHSQRLPQRRALPARALDLVEAAMPVEDNDDALSWILPWARTDPAGLSDDPSAALGRVHRASRARLDTAEPGSTVQLAAFQSTISTAADASELRAWLGGADLPAGARRTSTCGGES